MNRAMTLSEYVKWLENKIHSGFTKLRFIQHYNDFLQSPFTPAMLAGEVFEGWKEEVGEQEWLDVPGTNDKCITFQMFGSKQGQLDIHHFEGTITYGTSQATGGGDYDEVNNTFIMPVTIGDFISDCQRVGIDLQFTEAVKQKYFK